MATGWLNPQESTGRYICRDRDKWHHIWEAIGPARDVFVNTIAPRIKEYLEDAVEPISSRVTWSMYMVGRTEFAASPSIIFCCEVLDHRREVRNTIRESGILDGYPGIKARHLPRPPDFDQLVPLGAGGQPMDHCGDMTALTSKGRSACGSQISLGSNGTKSLSSDFAATIGGVIRLGGHFYYTTAAHALLPTLDIAGGDKGLTAKDENGTDTGAAKLYGNEGLCSASTSNLGSEDMIPWNPLLDQSDDNRYLQDEILRQWSRKSYHEAEVPLSSLTKPGKVSPNPTGRTFMTSMDMEARDPGLDYALVEVSNKHHVLENLIQAGPSEGSFVKVRSVVRSWPQDVDIVAVTPRGTNRGWISGTPVYSSTPGKGTWNRMFKATLDGPLHRGDCGTWVVDATNGDLFGHVVLGSPGGGTALLIPFSDIFDDILSRVDELPTFPTALDDANSFKTAERRTSPPDALTRLIRKTISSIRETPQYRYGNDNDAYGRTSLSPIKSQAQTEEISSPPRVQGQSEVSTNQVLSETGGDVTITTTHPSHQQRSPRADRDTDGWAGDIPKLSGGLTAQKNLEPDRSRDKSRGPLEDGVEGNSRLSRDSTRNSSSGVFVPSSQPRSCTRSPNEAFDRPESLGHSKFQHVLFTFGKAPMRWEDTELLDLALKEIDLTTIFSEAEDEHERFISQARSEGDDTKPEWGYQDCVVRAFSRYFGRQFFTRIKNPSCDAGPCKLPTVRRGNVKPNSKEEAAGAEVVEVYKCAEQHCQAYTRFPRYWDPKTLLLNPRGRAAESSNCFGMLCRALGSRVRWVWSAEDCIWTEVYSEHQSRWVHVDAYEGAWDDPLLYTETMGKKMSYCIAFSSDGATDVTRRYVRSPGCALARKRCPESELLHIIDDMRSKRRRDMSKEEVARLEREDTAEAEELGSYIV